MCNLGTVQLALPWVYGDSVVHRVAVVVLVQAALVVGQMPTRVILSQQIQVLLCLVESSGTSFLAFWQTEEGGEVVQIVGLGNSRGSSTAFCFCGRWTGVLSALPYLISSLSSSYLIVGLECSVWKHNRF